jgi:TonB-dependent Receptor Plug Domain
VRCVFCIASGAALLLAGPVSAQSAGEAKDVYDRAALSAMGATTAEDMIRRIPGGSQILDANNGGGPNQRGFGASGAQILIDGRRISGKSNDMATALRRIDAKQVDRIELIRSTAEGLDVASEGVVINLQLIKGASSKGQGTIEVNARFTVCRSTDWFLMRERLVTLNIRRVLNAA